MTTTPNHRRRPPRDRTRPRARQHTITRRTITRRPTGRARRWSWIPTALRPGRSTAPAATASTRSAEPLRVEVPDPLRQQVLRDYHAQTLALACHGAQAWARAGWNTGGVPYGYRSRRVRVTPAGRRPRHRTVLVIEPAEAAVVRLIFAWRAHDRLRLGEIVHRLAAARYPGPIDPATGDTRLWTRSLARLLSFTALAADPAPGPPGNDYPAGYHHPARDRTRPKSSGAIPATPFSRHRKKATSTMTDTYQRHEIGHSRPDSDQSGIRPPAGNPAPSSAESRRAQGGTALVPVTPPICRQVPRDHHARTPARAQRAFTRNRREAGPWLHLFPHKAMVFPHRQKSMSSRELARSEPGLDSRDGRRTIARPPTGARPRGAVE